MAVCESIDFSLVPLVALRTKTRCTISQMLNGTKVIPSPSGLPRDWRGLAHIASVALPIGNSCDPTSAVLEKWINSMASFKDLLEAFVEIDRWDVLYDITASIEMDAKFFFNSKPCDKKVEANNEDIDKLILTVDDISLAQNGLELQYYDAFLLYSETDGDFALEVVNKLENKYGLKLCVKDRDLVGGISFEHEAIMRLISERCNRLIIIVSPSFLNSPANKFFVTYAQAIGIERGQRKIIPCIYKKLFLPPQLSCYYVLDYTRKSQLCNFWERLYKSVTSLPKDTRKNLESVTIKEIKDDEEENKLSLAMKVPDNWDCPAKNHTKESIKSDENENQLSIKRLEDRSACTSKGQSHSLLSKVLPKSLKEKSRTKRLFKKKKEALLAS
ncbi:hypothetical protein O3M35_012534 [Rhynocoris fuscipes]|uniref:TIR domain-containing protein n=1 Tax=Rhynocoris fuscipes TaxID=488301 RepID=A0AAW1CTY2_9HEMI